MWQKTMDLHLFFHKLKFPKSLFGFGPGCDIEFELDKSQTRKSIQVIDQTNNDTKKTKQLIYYDGEDVGGTVIDFIQYLFLYITTPKPC